MEREGDILKDDNKLIAVCKYVKLMNCLSTERRHSQSRRIDDVLQLNSNKYILYILLNNLIEILKEKR